MVRIGINGFGRIGRNFFKIVFDKQNDFEIVAVNDLTDPATIAHLLKYDSLYGRYDASVQATEDAIIVNGKKVKIFAEKDPEKLPWKELGVEIVLESTGLFTRKEKAEAHIRAGAKKVIISAPAKNEDFTLVMGANEDKYDPTNHNIISMASCTTNCTAIFTKIIDEAYSVRRGVMTTVHSYTNDQRILDLPHSDLRRSRAAAISMIPTTTGAAAAIGKVIPHLAGRLTGSAVRVPTAAVSLVDITFELEKYTSVGEVNSLFQSKAEGELKGLLGYCDEPLVSIDFKGEENSCVIDGLSTLVIDGNMVRIIAWYDNEWGYATRVSDMIRFMIQKGI